MLLLRRLFVPALVGSAITAANWPDHFLLVHADGLTTVTLVEATQSFADLGFQLDSSAAAAGIRTYRPATGLARKRVTLRLRVTDRGAVTAVSLGIAASYAAEMSTAALLHRPMIAGFLRELVLAADSAAARPFLAQIRDNWVGASDAGFASPSAADSTLPPKPTPAYLAFLGVRESADESWSSSHLSVKRLASGGDAVVVMPLAVPGTRVDVGSASDWANLRAAEILGGTVADFETSDFFYTLEMKQTSRTPSQVLYESKGIDEFFRMTLDTTGRAREVTVLSPGLMEATPRPRDRLVITAKLLPASLLSLVVALVPRTDSAAAHAFLLGAMLGTSGDAGRPGAEISALSKGQRTSVSLD